MPESVNIPSKHRPFLSRKAAERQCSAEEYVALLLEEDEAIESLERDLSQVGPVEEVGVDAAWENEIQARRRRLESGDATTVSRVELEASISQRLAE